MHSLASNSAPIKSLIPIILLVVMVGLYITDNLGQLTTPSLDTHYSSYVKAKKSGDYDAISIEEEIKIANFKVHSSCVDDSGQNSFRNTEVTDMSKNFQVKQDSWELTRKGSLGSGALTLHFQIMECPPMYSASTFHIQANTNETIFTGTVGPRHKYEKGCGFYNATVPIVPFATHENNTEKKNLKCGNTTVTSSSHISVGAFWTSAYRNYANRMDDLKKSQRLFDGKDTLTPEQMSEILGEDRLNYLTRHLDILPSFPIVVELPSDVLNAFEPRESMPNCTDIPTQDWLPVGTSYSTKDKSWKFQSHKCNYRSLERKDLQHWFAGMRVKYLGDSHGQFESNYVFRLTCPEANDTGIFFEDKYSCSMPSLDALQPKNTFSFAWRFYRAIVTPTGGDMDGGISSAIRQAKEEACTRVFGIGLYNATIFTTPSWLFVYETSEGLYNYLHSLKNSIEMCREMYPEGMDNLILLLQSPPASDVIPVAAKDASEGWRGNHNFRQEAFTHAMYGEFDGIIDGVIPAFEWTLAKNWLGPTKDGVHQSGDYYSEVFHVQTMAIISAMKNKGWQVPLMAEDDKSARWFDGVPLECKGFPAVCS